MDYKSTLNMPKSGFPMRAGLPKREPEMLKHWEEMDLYNLMLKKNEGKPRFALHDGPPFSNGGLHMGHALNKSLKDFITRSYAMRGYYTPYIPGWDNHGMPIESAIIKQNKLNHKAMSVADFRTACHQYADKYIGIQMEGFKRIGVLGDWEHPYKTMDPGFEAEEVKVFGEMYKKGYIYKGLKPVYWCYHDETALAEAEIEYQDDPCTTVYVKFPMNDDLGKLSHLDKSKLNFVIWTTTIWTLPGNLAIALHPDESYAIVRNDAGPAQAFHSTDGGQTWTSAADARMPIAPAKMYGGSLPDGRQYLIYNEQTAKKDRSRLVLALNPGGDAPFDHALILADGPDPELDAGPCWHYPCACIDGGMLHISCTASDETVVRHAALFSIPLENL